ncbi:zinc finger CCHC domain-containing protein 17 isoform X3 [Panthera onca]
MSSCRVDKPSEIVDVGDKVWVKLIGREMKNDRIKVSLSMKVVNQGTGKDLDPNNVIIEQEERRRRSFQDYTGQKITLEAVLNTTCKKCGCKGHFAKDCFMQPGGTKYSLIPDEEEEKEEAKSAEFEKPDPTRNSSRKRKKEKKKKKHRDRKSSDSDSSDSESDTGKRARHTSKDSKAAKKKKKKKKHKKKHKERSCYPLQLPLPEPDSCTGVQAPATGTAVEASLAVVGEQSGWPLPVGSALGCLVSIQHGGRGR